MVRIQLDLPDEQVRELEQLMADTGISTKKDLFNNALTLFQWAVAEKRAGRSIASVDEAEKKYKELIMPPLERARAGNSRAADARGDRLVPANQSR